MKKILLTFFIFCILLISFSLFSKVKADEFKTDAEVEYFIYDNGLTKVTYKITIENKFSETYARSFALFLTNIKPKEINVLQDNIKASVKEEINEDEVTLTVNLPQPPVGKGKKAEFTLEFYDEHLTDHIGDVWEVSIPKLSKDNSFNSFLIKLNVPKKLGSESYMSPEPLYTSTENGRIYYYFDKNIIENRGVSAAFGKSQTFSFSLGYHLENTSKKTRQFSIAIPPDTSLQKMYYTSIDPMPLNINVDEDGNWLAIYQMKPGERLDIVAKGSVVIFAQPIKYLTPTMDQIKSNTMETQYWQSNDSDIKNVANKLDSIRDIYDFVVNTLVYDYDKVKPDTVRLGAKEALLNKTSATCMEFTDLFIALARAKGIPAREINGYSYTENPEIKPLSLVADVLHAWPEYWDADRQSWIAVDPTWENTTQGSDFFTKLDLRHFAFVIRGKDPVKPYSPGSYKLGDNPQKDVFVTFGTTSDDIYKTPDIDLLFHKDKKLFNRFVFVNVVNNSPFAVYDLEPNIYFNKEYSDTKTIPVIPPFSYHTLKINKPNYFSSPHIKDTVTVTLKGIALDIPVKNPEYYLIIVPLLLIIMYFLIKAFKKRKYNIFQKV